MAWKGHRHIVTHIYSSVTETGVGSGKHLKARKEIPTFWSPCRSSLFLSLNYNETQEGQSPLLQGHSSCGCEVVSKAVMLYHFEVNSQDTCSICWASLTCLKKKRRQGKEWNTLFSGKWVLGQVTGQFLSWSVRYVDHPNHYCPISDVLAYLSLFPILVFFLCYDSWDFLKILLINMLAHSPFCSPQHLIAMNDTHHEFMSYSLEDVLFLIVNCGMCRYPTAVVNGNKSSDTDAEEEHTVFGFHLDVPSARCRQVCW